MMLLFRAAAPLNNKESKFSERYLLQMSHFSHQGAADFSKLVKIMIQIENTLITRGALFYWNY